MLQLLLSTLLQDRAWLQLRPSCMYGLMAIADSIGESANGNVVIGASVIGMNAMAIAMTTTAAKNAQA